MRELESHASNNISCFVPSTSLKVENSQIYNNNMHDLPNYNNVSKEWQKVVSKTRRSYASVVSSPLVNTSNPSIQHLNRSIT